MIEGAPRIENVEEFYEGIKDIQRRLFGAQLKDDNYILTQPGSEHSYFSPYYHFSKGLLTPELVEQMRTEDSGRILSVGAGPAYLEQLLVEMGIDKERFVLSDKEVGVLPEGFKQVQFDMFGPWPKDLGKFFLILFPESVRIHSDNPQPVFESLLIKAFKVLAEGGEIRMDGHGQNSKVTDRIATHLIDEGDVVDIQNDGKLLVATKNINDR